MGAIVIQWRLKEEFHKPYLPPGDKKWTKFCTGKTVRAVRAKIARIRTAHGGRMFEFRFKP